MEVNKRGLKMHELDDSEIIVQMDEKTNVDYFRQYGCSEKLRLHNFEQIERFCHRKRSERFKDQINNFSFRFYNVIKNFSDERRHSPGIETLPRHNISENIARNVSNYFEFYANGDNDKNKRFVVVNVISSFQCDFKNFERVICFISVIDNEGQERFTQTLLAFSSSELSADNKKISLRCVSRDEVLLHADELLHGDDLILCIQFDLGKFIFTEYDTIDSLSRQNYLTDLNACSSSELSTREKLDATSIRYLNREELLSHEHKLTESTPVISNKKFVLHKISFSEEEVDESHVGLHDHIVQEYLDSNLTKISRKNSSVKKQKLENKHFADSDRSCVLQEDIKPLSNVIRLVTGSYLPQLTYEEICNSYKVAHKYEIPPALDYFRDVLKKSVCVNNISLIHNLVKIFNDVELRMSLEDFLENNKESTKFFCNLMNVHFEEAESDMDDLKSEHVHNVFDEYIPSDNPFESNEQMKNKETEKEIDFSSIFSQNEKGQLILNLDSDFGQFMCSKSFVFKDMCELCSTNQTDIVPIKENFFGAIKNIYRLAMGTSYIKANTIHNIIELYEASNFYCIPPLLETCRNLFKKHICVRNVESIRKLSEMCDYDVDLKTIVESFQKDMDRFNITQEKSKEFIDYTEMDNSLKIEQHNFYQ